MSSTPTAQAAANIRAELARRRISQTALAAHLGVSQSWVASRLQGRTPFDVNELHAVAKFLGVPPSALLPDPPNGGVNAA
jgi:transcriptional regulator with XRE-family HTH domain